MAVHLARPWRCERRDGHDRQHDCARADSTIAPAKTRSKSCTSLSADAAGGARHQSPNQRGEAGPFACKAARQDRDQGDGAVSAARVQDELGSLEQVAERPAGSSIYYVITNLATPLLLHSYYYYYFLLLLFLFYDTAIGPLRSLFVFLLFFSKLLLAVLQ